MRYSSTRCVSSSCKPGVWCVPGIYEAQEHSSSSTTAIYYCWFMSFGAMEMAAVYCFMCDIIPGTWYQVQQCSSTVPGTPVQQYSSAHVIRRCDIIRVPTETLSPHVYDCPRLLTTHFGWAAEQQQPHQGGLRVARLCSSLVCMWNTCSLTPEMSVAFRLTDSCTS